METRLKHKKGFIFTLDAVIALIIVITILLISSYYITKSQGPSLSKLQLVKRGSDILLQLHYQKDVLDTLNSTLIYRNLSETTPANYNMQLHINSTTPNFPNLTVGDPIPSIDTLGSGRMIFVLTRDKKINNFYTVRYYIWTR